MGIGVEVSTDTGSAGSSAGIATITRVKVGVGITVVGVDKGVHPAGVQVVDPIEVGDQQAELTAEQVQFIRPEPQAGQGGMVIDIESIKKEGVLGELTAEELAAIAGIIGKAHYELGETLFRASQQDRSLHLIRSGEVKFCVAAPDGEQFTLSILKEGDMFGGMSFVDGTPRSATAVAIADVDTYRIEWPDFFDSAANRRCSALAV